MNSIVADGRGRWLGAWSYEFEQRALEWFADELNCCGWWRRQIVLWQLRRRLKAIIRRKWPSASTLW